MEKCQYGYTHYDTACVYCERDALKAIVRVMGRWMDKIGWPCQDNMAPEEEELYAEGVEITSRPEVRKIISEE